VGTSTAVQCPERRNTDTRILCRLRVPPPTRPPLPRRPHEASRDGMGRRPRRCASRTRCSGTTRASFAARSSSSASACWRPSSAIRATAHPLSGILRHWCTSRTGGATCASPGGDFIIQYSLSFTIPGSCVFFLFSNGKRKQTHPSPEL